MALFSLCLHFMVEIIRVSHIKENERKKKFGVRKSSLIYTYFPIIILFCTAAANDKNWHKFMILFLSMRSYFMIFHADFFLVWKIFSSFFFFCRRIFLLCRLSPLRFSENKIERKIVKNKVRTEWNLDMHWLEWEREIEMRAHKNYVFISQRLFATSGKFPRKPTSVYIKDNSCDSWLLIFTLKPYHPLPFSSHSSTTTAIRRRLL